MAFDYGKIKDNGQYENYPSNTVGEYVTPIRNTYVHKTCDTKTFMGDSFAETYAKNPKYYGRTFCTGCQAHFPVSEFTWSTDGIIVGDLGGAAGIDLKEDWPSNKYIR
jgi:hypothetical protein